MSQIPKEKKEPSIRQRKMNSFLQQKIAGILEEQEFSGITGLVTVTSVATTPDLREAKVWFSVLTQSPDEVLAVLDRHLYEIQGQVFKGASQRIVPKVSFHIDSAPEFAEHINTVLQHIDDEHNT